MTGMSLHQAGRVSVGGRAGNLAPPGHRPCSAPAIGALQHTPRWQRPV